MSGLRTVTPLLLLLAFGVNMSPAYSHSLSDPDKVITLELGERNVEQLAQKIEAVLVTRGFIRLSAMPRQTLDMAKLPASASPDEGIILAKFEKKSAVSLFVQVTTCRAAFTMRLPDSTNKSIGKQEIQSTQEILVSGLSGRDDMRVTVTDGLGVRDDPCVVPVRSNTSLERARER